MSNLKFLDHFAKTFRMESQWQKDLERAESAKQVLLSRRGKGNEFLGWLDLPEIMDAKALQNIRESAERLHEKATYLVVVGIGGSYLGARAILEALTPVFTRRESSKKQMKIIYAGHHLDADYHSSLLAFLENQDFCVNVISKSGTTTEPAIAFRLLLSLLERKYGKQNVKQRVVATTDSKKGALKSLADEYGFPTFVIPDDVGGRFSVLTPVGLLPICCAGFSINSFVEGANAMRESLFSTDPTNIAIQYAASRNHFYDMGKKIEVLVSYNPSLLYVAEWWKQLFGESEGKDKKGIFPASVQMTTDLHSMGQYLQDGERHIMETILEVESPKMDIYLTEKSDDADGLNYLAGKKLSEVNYNAMIGTSLAHNAGGVPCHVLKIPSLNEYHLGELLYFFEFACAVSGYMLDVNPFDQPGVEEYKTNMFALLGKVGYEKQRDKLNQKQNEFRGIE